MINHVFSHQVYFVRYTDNIYINTNLNKVSTTLKDTKKKSIFTTYHIVSYT